MGQIDTLANLQSQILILLLFDDPMEKVNALIQFYQFLDETKSYTCMTKVIFVSA